MSDHEARAEHTLEPPQHGHALGHATTHGPIDMVMDLVSSAAADAGQLASIIQTFPHARDEVMALLHRTLGAGFVREVVSKLETVELEEHAVVKHDELHEIVQQGAPETQPLEHEAWRRSNHDVTSAFPADLAALYDDCIAHVKAGTLVFPKKNKKKMPPPPATSEPFERFIHAFYKHFHVKERRINLEITKKGGDGSKAWYIRDYIESQLGTPLGEHSTHGAQRVHKKAEAAFLAMHEAAKKDGVLLKIVSGYRPPTDPDIPTDNDPLAKASNSSHNYGLAIDFQLSVDKHHAAPHDELHVKEATTKDMGNFMAYYGSSVSKWLVLNAAKFDFHPYSMEPWHFEYNPAGMAQEILDGVKTSKR